MFLEQVDQHHYIISLTENIRYDNGKITVDIFIDFKKAIDIINHVLLLDKLENYGLQRTVNG